VKGSKALPSSSLPEQTWGSFAHRRVALARRYDCYASSGLVDGARVISASIEAEQIGET
jgi:hypothetical protein